MSTFLNVIGSYILMEDDALIDAKDLLKVIAVDIMTTTADIFDGEETKQIDLPEIPLLNFELENGKNFIMTNIPLYIAIDIVRKLSGIEKQDSRLSLAEIIPELCVIKKVIIDSIVPFSTAYQATVEITLEGFSETVNFQMIPSHATLLALLSDAPIYVSKFVITDDDNEMVEK